MECMSNTVNVHESHCMCKKMIVFMHLILLAD